MPDKPELNYDAESEALRARVAKLAEGRSQSEIARKTGTSVANVNRYLKGTRMPAEFCAALVKGLGVNPAWLLAGEGTPYVSDITAGTASMGGNLLELVEAMTAVSQMRLGALTGKHHLKVLRELNDALTTYERLRARLNEHSVPIFRQLLGDLSRALDKFETDRAREILKAAEQVARLCDEPSLARQLLTLQAAHTYLTNDHAKALEYQRQLMLFPLSKGEIVSDENLQTVNRLVLSLHTLGGHHEALRVCEAALALIPPEGRNWQAFPMLAFLRGRIKAELGDLLEGIAIMVREMPRQDARRMHALRFWLTPHLLRAGLLRPQDAFEFGENIGPKGVMLLEYACAVEDAEYLERACKFAEDEKAAKMGDLVRPPLYGPILLRAMRGDKKAPAAFDAIRPRFIEDVKAFPDIFVAQLHRMLDNRKAAQSAYEAAQASLVAAGKHRWVDILTRGIHHRTGQWLGGDAKTRADAFFNEHIAKGFVCFAPLAAGRAPA